MKVNKLWSVLLAGLLCLSALTAWAEAAGPVRMPDGQTDEADSDMVFCLRAEGLTLGEVSWMPVEGKTSEAYLFAKMSNETDGTVWIDRAHVYGYDKNGAKVFEQTYVSVSKRVLLPGECAYLDVWLRDYMDNPEQLATVEMVIEEKTSHSQTVKTVCTVTGEVEDGAAVLTIENAMTETVFDVCVSGAVYDGEGRIVFVLSGEIGYYVGIPAGGSLVYMQKLPGALADHADGQLSIRAETYTFTEE